MDALLEVSRRHDVSVVLPTIDVELEPLAAAKELLGGHGVRVVVSTLESVGRCVDKWQTFTELTAGGVDCVPTVLWGPQTDMA